MCIRDRYEAETGQVKMTDFGIARLTDASKTKTGIILGTPSYMSPEQLSGSKIDGRSDLFSLGVMFYQLATGQLPFVGESMATLMFKITNEPQVSANTLNAAVSLCLASVMDRMLEKTLETVSYTHLDVYKRQVLREPQILAKNYRERYAL